MKKALLLVFLSMFFLAGCFAFTSQEDKEDPSISSSYQLETGEIITIEVSAVYQQVAETPFQITLNQEPVFVGNFVTSSWCDEQIKVSKSKKEQIRYGVKSNNEYLLFFDKELDEFEYLIKLHNTDIAISLVSNQEQEAIETCFYSIQIIQQ